VTRDAVSARREPAQPPNTLRYFLQEALRRIWISKRTSFVAIGMIAISLLILGAFLLVSENLGRDIRRWEGRSRVRIYFEAQASAEDIRAVDAFLAGHPDLARRTFVSREAALDRFKKSFSSLSEVVGQLEENPFPPSYECEVSPQVAQSPLFDRETAALRAMNGVEQVQFDWEWVSRLKRLVNIVNLIGFVAGGVLAAAAAFTIANVIRLTMLLYREEIEIMRLVGATEHIIRGPFLIEGLVQGTLGGLLAVGLLYAAFAGARALLAPANALLWSFLFAGFLPWQKSAALILGGTAAGFLGSWLSVRERGEPTGKPD
jgi:cell division transport system permease protein